MKKMFKKCCGQFVLALSALMYTSFVSAGEDILKNPTANVFATFCGTGIDLLLLIEICAAAYIFSTGERRIKTWVGLPIIILVTAYASAKFGG